MKKLGMFLLLLSVATFTFGCSEQTDGTTEPAPAADGGEAGGGAGGEAGSAGGGEGGSSETE